MKPKIFVSSTVIDFEDLRSAIKYYLEEYGYDVQMSEYPNFNIDTDKSTFDACITNLEKCQYFILLIGYRRGNWYSDSKISITHKEFLSAKSLIEKGHRLRIIAFVRKPIWLLRNDRQELLKHFEGKSMELSSSIAHIGTTVIDDPDYIFDFLDEVSKGIKFPGSDYPANNWIYDFTSFDDIAVALKSTLGISENLERKRLETLFITELRTNKQKFLIPQKEINIDDYKDDYTKIPQENFLETIATKYGRYIIGKDGKSLIGIKKILIDNSDMAELIFYLSILPIQKS